MSDEATRPTAEELAARGWKYMHHPPDDVIFCTNCGRSFILADADNHQCLKSALSINQGRFKL